MSSTDEVVFLDHTLPSKCVSMFKSMRQNQEFCDIILRFEGRAIYAHRIVIFAAFPHLREVFCSQESGNGVGEITLVIEPSALESLIDFAYSCELEITNGNVEDLLSAAMQLKTDEIQEACCDFISKQLTLQNVLEKLQLAEDLCCSALIGKCCQFICEHFDEVSSTEDFLNVSLSSLEELIRSDELKTSCEEKVFEAVINWVRKNPKERTQDLPKLLRHVRLMHVTSQYLIHHILMVEEIRTSIVCRSLVDDARYQRTQQMKGKRCSLVTRPRKKLCIEVEEDRTQGGIAGAGIYAISKQVSLTVQHFDPDSGGWKLLETLPYHVQSGTAVSAADTTYFIDGGFLRSRKTRDTTWSSHAFLIDRFFAASAILDNKIYICGGRNARYCLNTVACFDLATGTHDDIPPMSEGRFLCAAVASAGYLYVLGGHNGFHSVSYVERYNPVSRTWEKLFPMGTDRFGMGCTAHDGKVYVCGGHSILRGTYLKSVEVYDPLQFQWRDLSPMNVERYQCSLVSCGGNLYAIGGCSGEDAYLNSIEIYDPESDEWRFGPNMDPTQIYLQAVSVG